MSKRDIVQICLRLNLENPMELRLYQKLLNINTKLYKSKNKYIVKKLIKGIWGEEDELEGQEMELQPDTLLELEIRITENVTNALLEKLLRITSISKPIAEVTHEGNTVDEDIASAAIGYFEE